MVADKTMLSVKLRQISWGVLAIEALAIFLSVFLAFGVTAWRESRADARLGRQALENFRSELADNQREVEARLPYHQSVLDGLRETLASDSMPRTYAEASERSGFRGPSVAFLQQTALRTADATGAIALLDYRTAKAVTAVYELQRLLQVAQESIVDAALNPVMFAPENLPGALVSLTTYFEIVVEYESALLHAYPEVLAILDLQLNSTSSASIAPTDTTSSNAVN